MWLLWLRGLTPESDLDEKRLRRLAVTRGLRDEEWVALEGYRVSSGLHDAFTDLRRHHPSSEALTRALQLWFDRFRTMRLLHHLRDAALPNLGWTHALADAWFLPRSLREALAAGDGQAYADLRRHEELRQWVETGRPRTDSV